VAKPCPVEKNVSEIDAHSLEKQKKLFFQDMDITFTSPSIIEKKKLAEQYHLLTMCTTPCIFESLTVSPLCYVGVHWPTHIFCFFTQPFK
jgi:hypothetical protein